jgi:soluble lytic murein transglycosylase-like protein
MLGQNRAGQAKRAKFLPLITLTAQRYGLEVATLVALVEVESGFNAQAVSPKGARGLMQLMPATARRYGMQEVRELDDPARNLDIGARHLRDLLARHGGQAALAFAAYNAGQGAVAKHGQRIPSYPETMLYVPAVMAKAALFTLPSESP